MLICCFVCSQVNPVFVGEEPVVNVMPNVVDTLGNTVEEKQDRPARRTVNLELMGQVVDQRGADQRPVGAVAGEGKVLPSIVQNEPLLRVPIALPRAFQPLKQAVG
jgi:hypothetical protein